MRTLPCLLLLGLSLLSSAEPAEPSEALSEALCTEEVTRDPNAAADQYAKILEAYNAQRAHASTALFRLTE
jgi:hypothetical protein